MNYSKKIAIIGSGNMGASLVGGLIKNQYPASHIWITDPNIQKLNQLKSKLDINVTQDNNVAIKHADVVLFAVKPPTLVPLLKEVAESLQQKKPLLISIATGVRVESIEKALGEKGAIVRAMPNTPALIGCGATALFANDAVTELQKEWTESLLRTVGLVVWVTKENLLDNITALSGAGPAYFFLMMEALQTAATELGLDSETARVLTIQTAYGAAKMALESDINVEELRKQVALPGGSTEAALKIMEEKNIRALYKEALIAAKKRAEEMALLFGN